MTTKLEAAGATLQVGGIFFALGLAMSIAGMAVSIPRWMLAANGAVATGVVVSYETGSKGKVRPVVEFAPPGRKGVRTTATVGGSRGDYRLGQQVRVYYDRSDPESNVIDSFTELYFFAILLTGMGGMWLVIATPMILFGIFRRRLRAAVKRNGWHLQGRVVEVVPHRVKNGYRYVPVVEARHPTTGAPMRFEGDREDEMQAGGQPALVHVEPVPPYRYFVELAMRE